MDDVLPLCLIATTLTCIFHGGMQGIDWQTFLWVPFVTLVLALAAVLLPADGDDGE